jgi:predicted Zn-dependent protease
VRIAALPTAVAAAALLFCGCAPVPVSEKDRGQERIIERGRMIRYFGDEYRFVWDPEVIAPVRRIGRTLSRAVGASDNSFHFYVLDSPMVNAFTSPLGDIFIFSGMLVKMRSSSELAGVLAHEIGHVRADHFARQQKKAALSNIPGLMAAILSGGDPRVIASVIAVAQSYQLHWSREMEVESDRLALQYLRKTSFDPQGLLGGLEVIEQGERLIPTNAPEHLMTHPVMSDRIASMESSLGMAPGVDYDPDPDPSWDRLRAILLALTERPEVARGIIRARSFAGEGEGESLAGLVLARQERYREAMEKFLQASLAAPENPHYLADLGASLFLIGEYREAREALQRSLALDREGGSSYTHYYLGEIYRLEKDGTAADDSFRRAVHSWPPLPVAHYQFALLLSGDGKLGEADYHFGKAARLRGDYAAALRSFSRARSRLGTDPLWGIRIAEELQGMQ